MLNHSASRTHVQQVFSKPCLVNLISKDTHLVFSKRQLVPAYTYPKPTAVAMARPRAADFPRPLAAVMATVLRNVFSDIASTNFNRPLACKYSILPLNAPIATKVVCLSHLLKYLRSLYGKQCGPRSDCSYRSSLFWAHAVFFYTQFVSNVRQLFAADNFSRRHFQKHVFVLAR